MREEGRAAWALEWVTRALLVAGIGAAGIVALGGLVSKSTASTSFGPDGGMGWTDGVNPWAIWAFLGGVTVVALLLGGRSHGEGLWLLAGAGAFLLWHAGNEAARYRERLEAGMFRNYDEHILSFGLRVVPTVGRVGAVIVGALALLTLGSMVARRVDGDRAGVLEAG